MSKIKSVHAKEIFDSRGNPTVECEVETDEGIFGASVPSGASTGIHEALELRDGDKNRHNGKGVLKAVENVNKIISKALIGKNPENQKEIDEIMLKLDGTKNKSKLGANAILSVSMATCRAGAAARGIPLYKHIAQLAGKQEEKFILPVPSFNVINGGRHAKNKLAMQEFMILPIGAGSFSEAFRMGKEVYNKLKEIIKERYGESSLNIGDEGGFAPNIQSNKEGLELLKDAIAKAGYDDKIKIGMDVAASELFESGSYNLNFKGDKPEMKNGNEMIELYLDFIKKYGIISIEDPFEQEDFDNYSKLTKKVGKEVQIVGDDLLVTNVERIKRAVERKACNALLLKINQIGTITESIDAYKLSKKAGWGVMVSHRSGETEDSFIADLVVGLGSGQIKTGAPFRPERLAKYNRLEQIEKELGKKASYAGSNFRKA